MGALIQPTNKISARVAGAWVTTPQIAGGHSGMVNALHVSVRVAGAWIMRYSTPNGTLSGGGAASNSGASSSGTVSVTTTAIPGGVNSGSLSYQWTGGVSLSYSGTTTPTLTGLQNFSGVANGSSSTGPSDTGVYCIITDTITGAQWATDPVTIGPFTWTNTIPATTPIVVSNTSFFGSVFDNVLFSTVFVAADMTPYISGGNGSYLFSWSFNPGGSSSGVTFGIDNASIINPNMTCGVPCSPHDSQTAIGSWNLTVNDTIGSPAGFATVQTNHTHTRP